MQRALLLGFSVSAAGALPVFGQTCDFDNPDVASRIAVCEQAYQSAPDNAAAAYALSVKGHAQRVTGDLDGASQTLAAAVNLTPEDGWLWVQLGLVRFNQNDVPGSIAYYSAAIALSDDGNAYANRADSWWFLRVAQRCSDDADQALRIQPDYPFANDVKGRCLLDLGQPEQALNYFDTAIRQDAGFQRAYFDKITALMMLERYQEVVQLADYVLQPGIIQQSVPWLEEGIRAQRLLAFSFYGAANMVSAEADALLNAYPGNLAAINVKAMALVTAGRFAEADAAAGPMRQNTDGRDMEGAYYDTLAQIDIALGRLDAGYANFQAALKRSPGLSRVYAKKLSELGFLPLSNSPEGVLTALRRCIDVRKNDCAVAG
ncbi:MAG: hypothetical protein HC844_09415 [Tabrizicola sp.]|nr:hypothetical protein [Tabrizicola sp.]